MRQTSQYLNGRRQPVVYSNRRTADGKKIPMRLNEAEQFHADYLQRQMSERFHNALGYEVPITTLSTIMKKVTEQSFYQIPPAKYLPVLVGGEGAWSSNVVTYTQYTMSGGFEDGVINTGSQNDRLANADAGITPTILDVINWAYGATWNIFDLRQAAKAGNWDIVTAKEEARKTIWDLGIQKTAFLGLPGSNGTSGNVLGLLNQPSVTTNTTVITQSIGSMTTTQLKTFCGAIVEAYRANCFRTAWPTHFIIPESDYNSLASQASSDFPIRSTLDLLEETFEIITNNPNFEILPLAYGDTAYSGLSQQMYVLLNYNEKSLNMRVPVPYTNTLANSLNNFQFQSAALGQFTGVQVIKPLEVLYFAYTP